MSCKGVLLVDDDEDIRTTLSDALTAEGYNVLLTTDGKFALDLLDNISDECLPGLIILDLQMPVMDGLTFLNHRSVNKKISKIPVIITSAKGSLCDPNNVPIELEKIPKPMDLDDLYSMVLKHCGKPV